VDEPVERDHFRDTFGETTLEFWRAGANDGVVTVPMQGTIVQVLVESAPPSRSVT